MEGLIDVPVYQYTGLRGLRKHINARCTELLAGSEKEYLVFRGVTDDVIAAIYRNRASIGNHTRLTHYNNINLLIVKILWGAIPRALHRVLASDIEDALTGMALPLHSQWDDTPRP